MYIWFIRFLFILLGTVLGYFTESIHGAIAGFVISTMLVSLEYFFKRSVFKDLLACLIGLIIGLAVACLVVHLSSTIGIKSNVFVTGTSLILSYIGMMTVYRRRDELNIPLIMSNKAQSNLQQYNSRSKNCKILDTSVLIDGRIADICQTGFIEGTLLVPGFILRELQYIADSTNGLRRNKGRRGFQVLDMMQNAPDIDMQITEEDFPDTDDVDAKIIQLAQEQNAKVITNDFNLNKVAELQGVTVLNINELADSVKPMVLPGESMTVRVIREGKESNQGVAYLDDGTMVIVEEGKKYVGQSIQVVVTTVLQTNAGRMIFTRKKGDEMEYIEYEDIRSHPRSWQRGKNGQRY